MRSHMHSVVAVVALCVGVMLTQTQVVQATSSTTMQTTTDDGSGDTTTMRTTTDQATTELPACPPLEPVSTRTLTVECDESERMCNATCPVGFVGAGMYTCDKDGVWQGPSDVECLPVNCGPLEFMFSGDAKKDAMPCVNTTYMATCGVECSAGHGPVDEEETYICDADGHWKLSGAGLTCSDIDSCTPNPCAPERSWCQDLAAPAVGYVCKCSPGYTGDTSAVASSGLGCDRPHLEAEEGNLRFIVGAGNKFLFEQTGSDEAAIDVGELRAEVDGLLEAEVSVDARISTNEGEMTTLSTSLSSWIDGVEQSVTTLKSGEVAANAAQIGLLSSEAVRVDTALLSESARAQSEEATLAASISDLYVKHAAEATEQTSVSIEASAANKKVDAEVIRAMSAEGVLATRILNVEGDHSSLSDSHSITKQQAAQIEEDLDAEVLRAKSVETRLENTLNSVQGKTESVSNLVRSIDSDQDGISRALSSEVQRSTATDGQLTTRVTNLENGAVNQAALNNAINALRAQVFQQMCGAFGVGYNSGTQSCNIPKIGTSNVNPASSCAELRSTAHGGSSGVYWLAKGNRVYRTYCDQTGYGGNWELLMTIDGRSDQYEYNDAPWVDPRWVQDGNVGPHWGINSKYWGYNVGRYAELRVQWRDPYDGAQWVWWTPSGFSAQHTPFEYFTTPRVITNNVYGTMEWQNSGGRFSSQSCANQLAVAVCHHDKCVRWGFHFNNECDFNSNDVGGGIGIAVNLGRNARSAGDWIGCCQNRNGRNRDFDVQIWAR